MCHYPLSWFASQTPVEAIEITFTSLPSSSETIGSTHSFSVEVDIADDELLPIQSVNLAIYNSTDPDTYTANCTNLPYASAIKTYTSDETGGGEVTVTATPAAGWGLPSPT